MNEQNTDEYTKAMTLNDQVTITHESEFIDSEPQVNWDQRQNQYEHKNGFFIGEKCILIANLLLTEHDWIESVL